MDINNIVNIEDDLLRNEELYKVFLEDNRLCSRAGSIEKITTLREIEKYITSDSKLLDVGAATGAYTLPLAAKANEIAAIEPASVNYKILLDRITEEKIQNIKAYKKSSLDMDDLPSNYFDIVLLFGPMYHLSKEEDRQRTLEEAKRVCKKDGHIFVAFINHDMIPITETIHDANYLLDEYYKPETQRFINRPFIFFTLSECVEMLEKADFPIVEKIASDGFSEVLSQQLNEMSDEAFTLYLDWHLSHCKNPELLGATNHFLFVCKMTTK